MSESMPYEDASLPVEERVEDLLGRMTIEEKIGQMCQLDGRMDAEKNLTEKHLGSFLHVMGEPTLRLQKAAEQTRLGIPLIFGIDAIHGHAFWPNATVFPTQLGLSSSWNPHLLEQVARVTAREARLTGIHWTFSPVLCLARDLRWGRIGETFGEDHYLVGELACGMIRGYQTEDLTRPDVILACAKHYAGYSETQGGRDALEADLSRRKMLNYFLPAFEAAAKAGCATFMTAYEAIDGVPCTASRWLLTEVLKEGWGLEGFVVTDWNNVGALHTLQKVCPTMQEAAEVAVKAGNDMMMSTPDFPEMALAAVRAGRLEESLIDEACRRILRMKFMLGLFDGRRDPDWEKREEVIGCRAHREIALEAACQSLVLLKNEKQTLPIAEDIRRIAVIGPNADDVPAQLGDWSFGSGQADFESEGHSRESIVTVLDGIRRRAGEGVQVDYVRGCEILDPRADGIPEAVAAARAADVAVLVIGDNLEQNGEFKDRANLSLSGGQSPLLAALKETGTPLVVVLINGKPLSIPEVAENADAILEAWNPGMEGGTAVAAVLFGDRNPSGKLTISFPHHVGQLPVYYNQLPGWHGGQYIDAPAQPLFVFGYGLSYTSFNYQNLRTRSRELAPGDALVAEVDVTNTGERAGVEIVQLYINDVYSSVTTPVKELKAWARVELEPGRTETVRLAVPYERLALVTPELERVVEPGEFEVMVGGSSRDEDLLKVMVEVME